MVHLSLDSVVVLPDGTVRDSRSKEVPVHPGTSESNAKNSKSLNGDSVDALWPFRTNECLYRGPCILKIGLFLLCENRGSNWVAALERKTKSSPRQFL